MGCNQSGVQGTQDADVAALSRRLDNLQATIAVQDAIIADLKTTIAAQGDTLAALDNRVTTNAQGSATVGDLRALDTRVAAIEADYLTQASLVGYATESWVSTQGYSTQGIDPALSDLLNYLSIDTNTDSVVFTGANVYVQSGGGSTNATINGLGNLIVGYNEDNGDVRTGSHNLIVGSNHSYSSFGGVVFGYDNSVSGIFSSVTGGDWGAASGDYSLSLIHI